MPRLVARAKTPRTTAHSDSTFVNAPKFFPDCSIMLFYESANQLRKSDRVQHSPVMHARGCGNSAFLEILP